MSDEQLSALEQLIQTRFGAASEQRRQRIALIGLRGAGKSTIGARLAQVTGARFVEVDSEIEREMEADLGTIFSLYGQDAYRQAEMRVLDRLVDADGPVVLATGGSIVTAPGTYEHLRSRCYTVWLRADPHDHMARVTAQGDLRPMSGHEHAMTELRSILEQRRHLYELADLAVDTSRSGVAETVAQIQRAVC